jgi:predicted RNase H-like HicB family nuclease
MLAKHVSAQMNLHLDKSEKSMKQFKIVIEKHPDGYVAYPIGVVGAIVGQGDTYEEALSDVKSAIACYIEVFGKEMLEDTASVEVFIAEAGVSV